MIPVDPKTVLDAFDTYLTARQLRFEAVLIGGAALNLLGIVHRTTKDCDILHPALPPAIAAAAREFAATSRRAGEVLARDILRDLGKRLGHGL